jgi:hypothetical protein
MIREQNGVIKFSFLGRKSRKRKAKGRKSASEEIGIGIQNSFEIKRS